LGIGSSSLTLNPIPLGTVIQDVQHELGHVQRLRAEPTK
jgi:hypothetical protein